jgi:hypothetical protein
MACQRHAKKMKRSNLLGYENPKSEEFHSFPDSRAEATLGRSGVDRPPNLGQGAMLVCGDELGV